MPKFAVVIKQNGEGCDYTIGCGMTFVELRATSREEALLEAQTVVQGTPNEGATYGYEETMMMDFDHDKNSKIEYAKLVQLEEDLPVDTWFAEIQAACARRTAASTQAKERAEYERLRTKFG